jgi:hypothetical protein
MIQSQPLTISIDELQQVLEPLIRRVVREELVRIAKTQPSIFYLDPDMPLYQDMEDIAQRKAQGAIKLYSHHEVWHEQL